MDENSKNDERQKLEAELAAMAVFGEASSEGQLKTDSSFSATEAGVLAARYDTNFDDVSPALPPVALAFRPQTATVGGDWRASVATYRKERDEKTSDKTSGPSPFAAPQAPRADAGAQKTLARVQVLQGMEGITDPGERRRRIAENLGQSPTKEALQFVAADGTLC